MLIIKQSESFLTTSIVNNSTVYFQNFLLTLPKFRIWLSPRERMMLPVQMMRRFRSAARHRLLCGWWHSVEDVQLKVIEAVALRHRDAGCDLGRWNHSNNLTVAPRLRLVSCRFTNKRTEATFFFWLCQSCRVFCLLTSKIKTYAHVSSWDVFYDADKLLV